LLIKNVPLSVDDDTRVYETGEAIAHRLTYFAVSMFWRGAAHHWRIGRDFSQLLRLGPFEESLRLYLLGQAAFPPRAAVLVNVSNQPNPPLGASYPMTYTQGTASRFHRFHIPGVMFTLYLGNSASEVQPLSVTEAGHPICFGPSSDQLFLSNIVDFIRRNNPPRRV
jgi:hypothetical protein